MVLEIETHYRRRRVPWIGKQEHSRNLDSGLEGNSIWSATFLNLDIVHSAGEDEHGNPPVF
jgi:hypothetical protein